MIERFAPSVQATMAPAPNGPFVRYADYEQLEFRATRDRALATRMRDALAKLQIELDALANAKPRATSPLCAPTSAPSSAADALTVTRRGSEGNLAEKDVTLLGGRRA
ncbi:MAG TPA: hypothetical protein VGK73_08920 [Polyangiaceae bacterium]